MSTPEHDVVATPDGRFAYIADGSKSAPLVLLLHGFPDHPPSFRPVMARLAAAGYRAVAPWTRGYAPSTPNGPFHADQLAADVIALIEALSPTRPARVIGHDWGAVATYGALAAEPGRIGAAVAMSVPHPMAFMANVRRRPAQLRRSWYMLFFQLPGLPEYVVSRNDFAFIDRLWRDWSPGLAPDPGDMAELKLCLAASMPAPLEYYRAIARPLRDASRRIQRASHERIRSPTLVLHGADDGCIAPSLGAGQELHFDGPFSAELIEGAGHFLQVEAPDAVAGAAIRWFREADAL